MKKFLSPDRIEQTRRFLVLGVCSIAILSLGAHEILGQNGYLSRRRRRMEIQSLDADIQKLKQENAELSRKIQNLRSNPNTIEQLAREQLRLGRPGDVVITLPPERQPTPPPAAVSPSK